MVFFAWAAGLGVNDFSAVDRRIEYLRRKIFEYDDTGRMDAQLNPQAAIQKSIDQRDYQEELEELMYLRALPGQLATQAVAKAKEPTSIPVWQVAIVAFSSLLALAVAILSLWLVTV